MQNNNYSLECRSAGAISDVTEYKTVVGQKGLHAAGSFNTAACNVRMSTVRSSCFHLAFFMKNLVTSSACDDAALSILTGQKRQNAIMPFGEVTGH